MITEDFTAARTRPTPADLRELMTLHHLSRQGVADILPDISVRQVEGWLLPVESPSHRPMSAMAWELLQIKLQTVDENC